MKILAFRPGWSFKKGKRIKSFDACSIMLKTDYNAKKKWEMIQEASGWMKIKCSDLDYYLELSDTDASGEYTSGEPRARSKYIF